MGPVVAVVFLILLAGGPVLLTIVNLINVLKRKSILAWVEYPTLALGALCSLLLVAFVEFLPPDEPRIANDSLSLYSPISRADSGLIAAAAVLGVVGFVTLRETIAPPPGGTMSMKERATQDQPETDGIPVSYSPRSIPPLLAVLCLAAMYLTCVAAVFWLVQIWGGVADKGWSFWMSLVPLNFLLLTVTTQIRVFRTRRATISDSSEQRHRLLWWSIRISNKVETWPAYALVAIFPLLGAMWSVSLLFGQQPDAAVRAFTNTAQWTFSTRTPPPAVTVDSHYLCTAALVGHRRVVRPTRAGVRHGRRIVVNRQLCVANAFEQLLEERVPRTHRLIRGSYHRFGLPVSRWIRTPLVADMTYLFMKPLEWAFIAVLYLSDCEPESRIARQYLPGAPTKTDTHAPSRNAP